MRRLMPTAKTTVLPANDSPATLKGFDLCEAISRRQPRSRTIRPRTDDEEAKMLFQENSYSALMQQPKVHNKVVSKIAK